MTWEKFKRSLAIGWLSGLATAFVACIIMWLIVAWPFSIMVGGFAMILWITVWSMETLS